MGMYTPNKEIPLNDREPGEIAEIALQQLMPFNSAAETWPIHFEMRDGRACNICRECDENIWFSTDLHNRPYQYQEAEIKALIVAHIRQIHSDMVVTTDERSRYED